MFSWYVQTDMEWVPDDPARTYYFGHISQNFEKPMLALTYVDLKLA